MFHRCDHCGETDANLTKVAAEYCGTVKSADLCHTCQREAPIQQVLAKMFKITPREVVGLGYTRDNFYRINRPVRHQASAAIGTEARA